MGNQQIHTAIDLCDLNLDYIVESDQAFSIGAMTPLRQLELRSGLNSYTNNAVQHALQDIVGVQFRNLATLGGSIWSRFGFSDVLTVFLAMDSDVELYRGGTIPLEEFNNMPHDDDILVALSIKKRPGRFAYQAMRNQRTDFPVLTCAVSELDGEFRAVIGARPGRAMVIRDTQQLLAGGITPESAAAFAAFVAEQVPTGSNLRGSAAYRSHLVRVLTERAILKLEEVEQ